MIKNAKENAKILIFKHFKSLFIPSIIIMLFNAIAYLFFNVIITYMYWEQYNHTVQVLLLICFMILEFVCMPFSTVAFFKTVYYLDRMSESDMKFSIKQTLSSEILSESVKGNLVPGLLCIVVYSCSTKVFYYNRNYTLIAIAASWIGIFISYKFFAVNYFVALGDKHPIKKSFELTKNFFGNICFLVFRS